MGVMEEFGGRAVIADELVEKVARRVVELLEANSAGELETAAELARRFAVDRSWVYAHADELGVVRLGDGPRARLRFDPHKVGELLDRRQLGPPAAADAVRATRRAGRPRKGTLPNDLQPLLGRRERHSRP
jgi:hypothetical protein